MQFSISDYTDPKHDTPGPVPDLGRRLLICTTPRTGGHFLCSLLRGAGLGRPTEYFGPQIALPLISRWFSAEYPDVRSAASVLPAYTKHLLQLRSKSGVFAAKIFSVDWSVVKAGFGPELQHAAFLIVRRRDLFAQTISTLALMKTGNAFNTDVPITHFQLRSEIDETVVTQTVKWIVRQDTMWGQLLAPYSRVFWTDMESVIANGRMITRKLSDILGVELTSPSTVPHENHQPYTQDRDLKLELAGRYGDLIRELVDRLQPNFTPPPNAQRVC